MQLKNKHKFIKGALTLATSTMLASVVQTGNAATDPEWEVDSAILYYSEPDRVTVVEPVVSVRKKISDDEYIGLRVVVDSLTGSSANGAIATDSAQTFTTPSGSGNYTSTAGQTPLDPSFHDTRIALNGSWETALNKTIKGIFSVNASSEYDYDSYGVAANISWDFNNRNTTLLTGLAYNSDTVKPVGGAPTGLNAMSASKTTQGSNLSKTVTDIFFGVTQVVNRNTLMQLNFSYGQDDGYLTDPYKILSVLDNNGNLRGTDPYLYEKRPTTRTRNAIFWQTVHQFSEDVVHFSYRYYWDDWGLNSNTIDARYRYELGGGHYLQPHLRYYQQNKADFYHYNLTDANIPEFASADYRLGDMTTTTFGLKYGLEIDDSQEFSARIESMNQAMGGDNKGPDVDAIILQLSYSLKF